MLKKQDVFIEEKEHYTGRMGVKTLERLRVLKAMRKIKSIQDFVSKAVVEKLDSDKLNGN